MSLTVVSPSQLVAAEGDVLFEDDFSLLDPAFSQIKEATASVKDNVLTLTVEGGWNNTCLYQSSIFNEVDMKVRARLAEPDAEKGALCDLVFWARDYGYYYCLSISDSGTYSVNYWNGQKWLYPMAWRNRFTEDRRRRMERVARRDGRHKGDRVYQRTSGGHDQRASTRRRQPGRDALRRRCRQDQPEFSAFQVLEPPPSEAPETPEDPNLLIADDFTTFDPVWGAESSSFRVSDGRLVVKSEVGRSVGKF